MKHVWSFIKVEFYWFHSRFYALGVNVEYPFADVRTVHQVKSIYRSTCVNTCCKCFINFWDFFFSFCIIHLQTTITVLMVIIVSLSSTNASVTLWLLDFVASASHTWSKDFSLSTHVDRCIKHYVLVVCPKRNARVPNHCEWLWPWLSIIGSGYLM